MKRLALAAFAMSLAACSSKPKGPALSIEIPALGAKLDGTGWKIPDKKNDVMSKLNASWVDVSTPGVVRVLEVANMRVTPGTHFTTWDDSNIVLLQSLSVGGKRADSLDACVNGEKTPLGGLQSYLKILVEPAHADRHGIDVLAWEDKTNLMAGGGPDTHRLREAAFKDGECFLIEVDANDNLWSKVASDAKRTLDSLQPL